MTLKKINREDEKVEIDETDSSEKPLILYVEDDDTNWDLAQVALSVKYRVVRAKNAREVFKHLGRQEFELILMDIELAGSNLNGIEITQVLKKVPSAPESREGQGIELESTPIIFVTAYSARYSKKDLLKAGGDDLVTKPVDFTRLSLAMSRMIVRQAFAPKTPKEKEAASSMPPIVVTDRRNFLRKSKVMPCELLLDGMRYVGQTLDISPGGVKAAVDMWDAPDRFPIGAEFELSLEPIWGDMTIPSKVSRICENEPYTIGVQFVSIRPDQAAALEEWLYQ